MYSKNYIKKLPSDLTIIAPVGYDDLTDIKNINNSNLQKMFLSTILNGTMMELGKTYKDKIIDINLEYKEDIVKLVEHITKKDNKIVVETLEKCAYKAKVAIVALLKNVSINKAVELIKINNGKIDVIIENCL